MVLLNRNRDGADLHFAEAGSEVFLAGLGGSTIGWVAQLLRSCRIE